MSSPRTAAEHRRQRRINRIVLPLVLIGAIGVPTLIITAVVQHQQIAGLSMALEAQRQQAQQSGQTPVAKPPGDVKANPGRPTVSPIPGPSGPGPSDAQVYAAVSAYFQAHPVQDGKSPSPAEIAAAVINYLTKHPPKDGEPGPPPSAEQVATQVAAYLTAHPPPAGPKGEKGDKGDQGDQGPGPTAQQIADAVAQYITDHPLPTCPDGYSAQAEQVLTAAGPKDGLLCEKD